MARSAPWRRTINDLVSWRQDQALRSTIYIIREVGPTGFHLKEENDDKIIKAFLGDPHLCSCSEFKKDKDLCKHICWLLLKKFRLSRINPVTWQVGLVEREINEVLRGLLSQTSNQKPQVKATTSSTDSRVVIEQRKITVDDVCPICQDGLLEKKLPVTFCKFGCGNSTHIKCMKIWADHQKSQSEKIIKCPFCREDFGPLDLLRQEDRNANQQGARAGSSGLARHFGVTCRGCYMNDINGKCYRCLTCVDYHLCQACFNTPIHQEHGFQFRQKRNQRWRPAQRPSGWLLPQAVTDDIMQREITDHDYDLLMQLDRQNDEALSSIPAEVVEALPQEKVHTGSQLLSRGVQCRMCLQSYHNEQIVRRLPCRHKFHRRCIDPWLIHSHPSCPVCGVVVWSEHMANMENDKRQNQIRQQTKRRLKEQHATHEQPFLLEIPGIGIAKLASYHGSENADENHHRNTLAADNHHSNTISDYDHHIGDMTADDDYHGNHNYSESPRETGLTASGHVIYGGNRVVGDGGVNLSRLRVRRGSDSGLILGSLPRRNAPRSTRRSYGTQGPNSSRLQPLTLQSEPQDTVLNGLHIESLLHTGEQQTQSADVHQTTRRLGLPRSDISVHTPTHNKRNILEGLFLGNNPRYNPRENGISSTAKKPPIRARNGQAGVRTTDGTAGYLNVGQLALDGVNIGQFSSNDT